MVEVDRRTVYHTGAWNRGEVDRRTVYHTRVHGIEARLTVVVCITQGCMGIYEVDCRLCITQGCME